MYDRVRKIIKAQDGNELTKKKSVWDKASDLFGKIESKLGEDVLGNGISAGISVASNSLNSNLSDKDAWSNSGAVSAIRSFKTGNPTIDFGKDLVFLAGDALNALGSKSYDKAYLDKYALENVGGSYGGSVKDIKTGQEYSGKEVGLFASTSKGNRAVAKANTMMRRISDISEEASNRRSLLSDANYMNRNFQINGGIDFNYLKAAKFGTKLQRIKKLNIHYYKPTKSIKESINLEEEWSPSIKQFEDGGNIGWTPIITEAIPEFKNGGKTEESKVEETTQKNVIPEGALHARKHHIEGTEGLTQKGIPVIDNNGEQQAEVEKEELTITLELTKFLEDLCDKYYSEDYTKAEKDQFAIDAGKELVQQILFNTEDRAGLIDKCKNGGKLEEKCHQTNY